MAEYSAHNVRDEVKTRWSVDISYLKVWRTREKYISYVRGTLEESYQKLPSWLYILEQKNHGTLTEFVKMVTNSSTHSFLLVRVVESSSHVDWSSH